MTDLRSPDKVAREVWEQMSEICGPSFASEVIKADREQVERDTIRRVVEWLRANSGFEDCYSELRDQWLSDRIAAGEWKQ